MSNSPKFKAGDVVIRTGGNYSGVKEGGEYVVAHCNRLNMRLEGLQDHYDPDFFELKEAFDLKNNPWFIRYEGVEEFNALRDFVKANGLKFAWSDKFDLRYVAVGLYINKNGKLESGVARFTEGDIKQFKIPEIKVNFKKEITVEILEYPTIETETQKKIRELEESAAKIQRQIEELKNLQK